MNILDSALALASRGIPVFACRTNKRPTTDGGFRVATTDPAEIRRLFADPLAALIGIPTGPASGFDVLDIDAKDNGLEWYFAHEDELPDTRQHHTAGGGLHLLFRHAPGVTNSASKIARGVDVRGDGGYVIWWPAHGHYVVDAPLTDWPTGLLIELMRGRRTSESATPTDPEELAPPDAETLIRFLDALPNPESVTRDGYTAVCLAVQGCIRGLEALGRIEPADADDIRDAAARWAARWESDRAGDFEAERKRWDDDWSTRDRDTSGWRQLLAFGERVGADTRPHRLAAAAAEFGALPEEPAPTAGGPRRIIRVRPDNLTTQINEAEAAIIAADLGLYQRAGAVVRVGTVREKSRTGESVEVQRPVEADENYLRELIGRCAEFIRYDAREKSDVATRCPPDVPRGYLARRSLEWNLPVLAGIVTAPTLRPDGSLLQAPGYDTATGLLFDPRGVAFPSMAEAPSEREARAALETLRALIAEFPFVDDASAAVALSAILTALVRRSLPAAPMHAFTAPAPGTGKSYLVELVCRIATGQPAPGCDYSADEAENRKQLDAALIAGSAVLILDNVDTEIRGSRLNQLLTQDRVTVRVLGLTKNVEVPCDTFVMANGNNLIVAADMTRRTLLCRMDAACERPELREFKANPLAEVQADRGRFVAAALTILRAYQVAGRPGRPKPLGSFEAWSDLVRGALMWLGIADPAATIEAVRENDPRRGDLVAVLEHWNHHIGDRRVTARELIQDAGQNAGFQDALLAVAGIAGSINGRRLGYWLRANRGKVVNGVRLLPDGVREGIGLWRLDGARPADISPDAVDLAAERARRAAATDIDLSSLVG